MAKKSESLMRKRVTDALNRHGGWAIPVENPAWPGTPDVYWCHGAWSHHGCWIELKQVAKPKREGTSVTVKCYSKEQRLWARMCEEAGGTCWMLIKVGRTYILIDGTVAADHLGTSTYSKLIDMSEWNGSGQDLDRELGQVLERYM